MGTKVAVTSSAVPDVQNLGDAVAEDLIEVATIDTAVRRLIIAKMKMGLLDPVEMVPFNNIPDEIVCCDAHNQLLKKAALESVVY
ncbi:MAG: hypothetical protein R2784_18585 [Saprospiraceae bacterium]